MDEKKQIEEMANIMAENWFNETIPQCAERLYNAGYQNCKDKVVLTREEYEERENKINEQCQTRTVKAYTDFLKVERYKARKETAREIIVEMFSYMGSQQQFCIVDDGNKTLIDCDNLFDFVGKLAKQYEVEVEE